MRYAQEDEAEIPSLRRLRRMVMALLVVLMLAILTIAATIVIRLGFGTTGGPVAARQFSLPQGEVVGIGQGEGTVLFLIRGDDGVERLHVFDADRGGAPVSVSVVARE